MNSISEIKGEKRLKGEYDVLVVSRNDIKNDNGGYTELNLLLNNSKAFKWNVWPSQYQYLANQLDYFLIDESDTTEYSLPDLIDMWKEHIIKLYFSWNPRFNKYDISFYPPKDNIKEDLGLTLDESDI